MSYAYLVAGFTLMIVLDGGEHGIREAIWRTANILLGCLIAIVVSQCVLPLRARNEWRWLLRRSDSPWYPSFRIFRQPAPNQWSPVMTKVGQLLAGRCS